MTCFTIYNNRLRSRGIFCIRPKKNALLKLLSRSQWMVGVCFVMVTPLSIGSKWIYTLKIILRRFSGNYPINILPWNAILFPFIFWRTLVCVHFLSKPTSFYGSDKIQCVWCIIVSVLFHLPLPQILLHNFY